MLWVEMDLSGGKRQLGKGNPKGKLGETSKKYPKGGGDLAYNVSNPKSKGRIEHKSSEKIGERVIL